MSGKKRAPLRRAPIEQQMEENRHKRRQVEVEPSDSHISDEDQDDPSNQLAPSRGVAVQSHASASTGRGRKADDARMQSMHAQAQRREAHEERMSRNIHEMSEAIYNEDSEVCEEFTIVHSKRLLIS